jgi:mevalonate kinase
MKVLAPGKLILSGEHAVVYGQPALAMAVNRYATATVTRETLPQVLFDLADLAYRKRVSVEGLRNIKSRLKRKYQRFIRGEYSIRDVLHKPFELAQFALGVFADALNLSLPHGVKIRVQSDIPIGCGMGSSAATIISVMHAVSSYLEVAITPDMLFELALQTENMQHGHSSGLDLRVAQSGGCLYLQDQTLQTRPIPALPMYLVNTGTPDTSTGECVETVKPHFQSQAFADEFGAVTKAMDAAIQLAHWQDMQTAIRENHRLLTHIGVVPVRVQQLMATIEEQGGAAKICGAGAVLGDQAGAVLAIVDDANALSTICDHFGYTVTPIIAESRGVHAA